jgi:thiol-disulfide isomerase/thioredoxin
VRNAFAALLAVCALAVPAFAQEEKTEVTLKPGDPAPKLQVDKWVKGEPVKAFEKGKVYVIECWATWCGPCVSAIPHVTELQKKYEKQGLVVIGMNIWENDVNEVEPFVKKMGEKMDYRVATDSIPAGKDSSEGKMAVTWMRAAGKNGIPCSFIVDRDLKVAWVGHPMSMDRPLQAVIDGKFDAKKEAETQEKTEAANAKLGAAMQGQKWDDATAAADELIALSPEAASSIAPVKVYILAQKGDYKAANEMAKKLSEGEYGKDQRLLLGVTYALLGEGEETPKDVDKALAVSIAQKAVDMGGDMGKAGRALLAKAHAASGDYNKAVQEMEKAMEGAEGRQKAMMQKDLDAYKAKASAKTDKKN